MIGEMIDHPRYRKWFMAAAIYNALWGTMVSIWPQIYFDALGMPRTNYPELMQAIGMIVGVYAIAYWLIARDPVRYGPFVFVGLLGKILGPLGFVFGALTHRLPWSFGLMNVTNDLIWLPVFVPFAIAVYRREKQA